MENALILWSWKVNLVYSHVLEAWFTFKIYELHKKLILKDKLKNVLAEVFVLIQLMYTIASTSMLVERSFSTLKQIKTITRSSQSEDTKKITRSQDLLDPRCNGLFLIIYQGSYFLIPRESNPIANILANRLLWDANASDITCMCYCKLGWSLYWVFSNFYADRGSYGSK